MIENYDGKATIQQGGGDVAVTVSYRTRRDRIPLDDAGVEWRDGLASWSGRIVVEEPDAVISVDDATLLLPMGERGEIAIMRVAGGDIEFIGFGEAPK